MRSPRILSLLGAASLCLAAGCGGDDEAVAQTVGNADEKAAFFSHDKLYYVRIVGWDPKKTTPQALEDDTTTKGAKLRVFVTDPKSDRHCPDGEGKLLHETEEFSMRTSGNFTKGTPKSSYKIKLRAEDTKQRFLGMKALNLKSMWNDVSQMREALAWDLFAKADVPAPRHAYAKVCINERYYGLYSVIEEIDKPFLKSEFGKHDEGNLYEAYWRDDDLGPADLGYRVKGGDDSGKQYKKSSDNDSRTYEQKTNEDDAAAATYDDLATLIRVLHGKTLPATVGDDPFDTPEFQAAIEEVFDVKAFLRWASVNMLLGAWDNYWGTPANYHLYNEVSIEEGGAQAPRFSWIPWDYDNSFGIDFFGTQWATVDIVDWSEHTRTTSKKLPMVEHLLENDEYLAYYLDHMECMLDRYYNESFITGRIGDEGKKPGLWALIRGAAFLESDTPTGAAHTGRQFTNDQVFWNGFRHFELQKGSMFTLGILHHVRMRHDSARKQITAVRKARKLVAASTPVCKAE